MATRILVVDNYDSFVFNLVQYLGQLGAECTVVRNDEVTADEASKYDGVLISPGPGTPEKAGVSIEMINYCAEKKDPTLWCLPWTSSNRCCIWRNCFSSTRVIARKNFASNSRRYSSIKYLTFTIYGNALSLTCSRASDNR